MSRKVIVTVIVATLIVAFVVAAGARIVRVPIDISIPRIPEAIRKAAPDLAIVSARANTAEGAKMFDVEVVVENRGIVDYRPGNTCQARVALWLSGGGYELLRLLKSEKVPALDAGESTTLHLDLHMPHEGGVWVVLQWDANPRNDREIIYFVY